MFVAPTFDPYAGLGGKRAPLSVGYSDDIGLVRPEAGTTQIGVSSECPTDTSSLVEA